MEDRLRVASRWIREILLVLALLATTSRARANRSSEEPQENAARTEADTRAEGSVKEELPADRTGRSGALVSVPRLQGEIRLDGVSDEPAWQLVEPVPLITETPEFGGPPAEPTEIRIAYDDEYLYVSGRMYAAPEHVFAASFKRDLFTPGTDYLGVSLDTFNDNENAVLFWTSPTGTRTDATISNDGEGDTFIDNSWNAFWDVAAVRSEEGWFAEMRIPFHSLRFQSTEGRVVMGVSVYRWIAKKNELYAYPAVEPKWGFWSYTKPSQIQDVVFEGIERREPVYVAPYLLGGVQQDAALNSTETGYRRVDDPTYDVGLDLKYGLTNNLTLDLTVNTDFAQVEADDQQINLTRFSLFFPEKRLFFLERASIFDYGFGGLSRLFYSRRIGLFDGEPVRIIGGARVVGRIGAWDVGALDMQTARTRLPDDSDELDDPSVVDGVLPSENFGVLRLRRRIVNPYSYAGGILTSRVGIDGGYHLGYGADAILRLFGNEYLLVNWALTQDDASDFDFMDASRSRLTWERRIYEGLGYGLTIGRSGARYDPAVGFELREDFTSIEPRIAFGWQPKGESRIERQRISFAGSAFLRNADGSLETLEVGPTWEVGFRSGAVLRAGLVGFHEDLVESFEIADGIEVPEGAYTFVDLESYIETPGGRPLYLIGTLNAGSFFDGRRFSFTLQPRWTASRFIELGAFYGFDYIRFPDRDQDVDIHLGRLRAQWTLNTNLAATAFVQYNSLDDAVVANVRIRFNPREGNDLYLVYNEGFNVDRNRLSPVLPFSDSRILVLKFTYTFRV